MRVRVVAVVLALSLVSCKSDHAPQGPTRAVPTQQPVQGKATMMTEQLPNATVRAAIDALQRGDQTAWSALFEADAKLFDDGSPRSLEKFTRDALGHERFTRIDRVENGGLNLTGDFHSDQWGDFRTYFRFVLAPSGKISRLDIGQAK